MAQVGLESELHEIRSNRLNQENQDQIETQELQQELLKIQVQLLTKEKEVSHGMCQVQLVMQYTFVLPRFCR